MICYILSFTVPSEAPTSVIVNAESSTSIVVNWSDVPAIDQNGIITQYEVVYEPLETFEDIIGPGTMNTIDMTVTLSNLQEYVVYNVSVRAYTSAGPGPFSAEIEQRTLEDGNDVPTV